MLHGPDPAMFRVWCYGPSWSPCLGWGWSPCRTLIGVSLDKVQTWPSAKIQRTDRSLLSLVSTAWNRPRNKSVIGSPCVAMVGGGCCGDGRPGQSSPSRNWAGLAHSGVGPWASISSAYLNEPARCWRNKLASTGWGCWAFTQAQASCFHLKSVARKLRSIRHRYQGAIRPAKPVSGVVLMLRVLASSRHRRRPLVLWRLIPLCDGLVTWARVGAWPPEAIQADEAPDGRSPPSG